MACDLIFREVLLSPMLVTGMFGKVDVAAEVTRTLGGNIKGHGNRHHGHMVVPRAVRTGAALGIAALYPEHKETLRLGGAASFHRFSLFSRANRVRLVQPDVWFSAGLLGDDPRVKERNKVAQRGARGKWIWKRR